MRRPANRLLLERAESTDLFVEGDQVLAELLEAVKLGHLLLRLAQGGGIGKGFRHGLAGHAASEAKLRIMCRVVVLAQRQVGLPQRRVTALMDPVEEHPSRGTPPGAWIFASPKLRDR